MEMFGLWVGGKPEENLWSTTQTDWLFLPLHSHCRQRASGSLGWGWSDGSRSEERMNRVCIKKGPEASCGLWTLRFRQVGCWGFPFLLDVDAELCLQKPNTMLVHPGERRSPSSFLQLTLEIITIVNLTELTAPLYFPRHVWLTVHIAS